ncbi:Hypothetical predicted protein [Paramuricea clavata]|uniref:Uncharacterized protein n=1 Tax=Paramuricea clavata TaxID=317549 RepID=A0A6S7LAN2_PARCT|nr:Hypothetical predicted protein [Paramuricea clavata]
MAATVLRNAFEAVSDALLIAMVLKGLPSNFKTFSATVVQRDKQMTFVEFKVALRSNEESEKSRNSSSETGENIMVTNRERTETESGAVAVETKRMIRSNADQIWGDSAKKAEDQGRTKIENNGHMFTFKVSDCGTSFSNNFLVDTGATSHIVNDISKFICFDEDFDANAHIIELADGSK